jgi:hypothetical protein
LFGQILTKLRSRLRMEAMVQLAELKLHIHDEYAKNDNAKQRLKRHIAGVPRSTETTQPAAQASSSATAPLAQTARSTETVDGNEHIIS